MDDDLFFEKPLSFCCCVPFFSFFHEKEEEEEEHNKQSNVVFSFVIMGGRIKQHFLDRGLTAKDIPLAFACVLLLSSSSSSSSSSLSFLFSLSFSVSHRKESARSTVVFDELRTDARIFVRSPFPLARLAGQIPRSLLHHLRGVHVGRRVRNPTVQNNLPAFRKHRGD